jgi:2-deoxystreptamine N-acetyl-D-glucosaminyltransferase/2-deoxystreptamine glucosyltransferase
VRHLVATSLGARLARAADVVYATGMIGRISLGAAFARTPLVVKLTSDPAFERSLRWRLAGADLIAFQTARGLRIQALRRARNSALERAERILIPSRALCDLALGWGVPSAKIVLLPNPVAPPPAGLPPREQLRHELGFEGPVLAYAGRLVAQKSLDVAIEAVRRSERVSLVLAGEGPERERLEQGAGRLRLDRRVRFLGPQPRAAVLELLYAADAALLSSSWENFPHVAVEALSVGTPVLATDVGGVGEIVEDGLNGLLVPPGDPDALTAAIDRYFGEPGLREQLRAHAAESVARFGPAAVYTRLETVLEEAAVR